MPFTKKPIEYFRRGYRGVARGAVIFEKTGLIWAFVSRHLLTPMIYNIFLNETKPNNSNLFWKNKYSYKPSFFKHYHTPCNPSVSAPVGDKLKWKCVLFTTLIPALQYLWFNINMLTETNCINVVLQTQFFKLSLNLPFHFITDNEYIEK